MLAPAGSQAVMTLTSLPNMPSLTPQPSASSSRFLTGDLLGLGFVIVGFLFLFFCEFDSLGSVQIEPRTEQSIMRGSEFSRNVSLELLLTFRGQRIEESHTLLRTITVAFVMIIPMFF